MITLAGLALSLALASGPVSFCTALLKVVETDSEAELFDAMCLTDASDDAADGPEEE